MDLSFTINKMEELYLEASSYLQVYKESLESMNQIMSELSKYWKSDETNTYQEFYQKYQEKYSKLIEARDMMMKFCNQIEDKKNEFIESSNNIINSFE